MEDAPGYDGKGRRLSGERRRERSWREHARRRVLRLPVACEKMAVKPPEADCGAEMEEIAAGSTYLTAI